MDWTSYYGFVAEQQGHRYLVVLTDGPRTEVAALGNMDDARELAEKLNRVLDEMEAGEEIKE